MNEVKAHGRADSPYLFVMVYKPSEPMEAWFWRQLHKCGVLKSQCRVVYLLNEPPAGKSNKPLVAQIRSARDRFNAEMARSSPQVVIPMGTEPFFTLTGINESILDARGYLIRKHMFRLMPKEVWKQVGVYVNASKATGAKKGDPKMKWVKEASPGALGSDFAGTVIPTYTLDYIRLNQFAVAPAFLEDIKRAKRAYDSDLREVGAAFTYISTLDELPEPETLGRVIAVDIETHGVDNEVIDLVSFSDGDTTGVLDWTEGARAYMERIFGLRKRIFAVHNSPFDIPRLVANGVHISTRTIERRIFDTMFGAVNIQPDLHKSLGRVAPVYLDLEPWKTSSRRKDSHWRAMVHSDPRGYSGKDSFYTYWIAVQEIAVMKDLGAWKYFMGRDGHPGPGVMATLPVLTEMSREGIPINVEEARRLCPDMEKDLLDLMQQWSALFPNVRFSSNPKLIKLLYKKWGLPIQRGDDDQVAVDELAFVRLAAFVRDNRLDLTIPGAWRDDPRCTVELFDLMLKIRKTSKILGTYVRPALLLDIPRVHPSYLPASKDDERGGKKMDSKGTTVTGRLASYKPNIQNQPKVIRVLYGTDKPSWCYLQHDYRSAELYVLAGCSGDEVLMADLNDPRPGGMHQLNADLLGVIRDTAKNVTYASQYLASPSKQSSMILEQAHIYVSPAECLQISEGIWGRYSKATAYKDYLVELCQDQKYITNAFGRTRFFHAGRAPAAVDFIPQSTVADILWCVLKPVRDIAKKYGGRIVTTVHDSIVTQVPFKNREAAAREIRDVMERRFDNVAPGFFIPVDVEWGEKGEPWGMVKKVKLDAAS